MNFSACPTPFSQNLINHLLCSQLPRDALPWVLLAGAAVAAAAVVHHKRNKRKSLLAFLVCASVPSLGSQLPRDALPWVLLAGGAVAAAAVVHHKRRCHRSRQQHIAAESVVGSSGPPLGACSAPLLSPHGPPFSPHAPHAPHAPHSAFHPSAFPHGSPPRPAQRSPHASALYSSASSARSPASCPGASPRNKHGAPSACNHGARSCTSGPRIRGTQGIGAPVAEASPQKELSGALSGVGPRIEGEGGRGERGDGGIWAEGCAEKGKGKAEVRGRRFRKREGREEAGEEVTSARIERPSGLYEIAAGAAAGAAGATGAGAGGAAGGGRSLLASAAEYGECPCF
ncbi:unnamed protein product [Closterium sp. NIES-53]